MGIAPLLPVKENPFMPDVQFKMPNLGISMKNLQVSQPRLNKQPPSIDGDGAEAQNQNRAAAAEGSLG